MQAEVFGASRGHERQREDAGDRAGWVGKPFVGPMQEPRQHVATGQHDSPEKHRHRGQHRHARASARGLRPELSEDDGEQPPAHEVVDERGRHDRAADVALEKPHVHQDSGDHRVGRKREDRPHEERRRELVLRGHADHAREQVAHHESEHERHERADAADEERLAAAAAEFVETDVEPDRHDEKQHSDPGDRPPRRRDRPRRRKEPGEEVRRQAAEHGGAEHEAAGDLADHGRDAEPPGEAAKRDGRGEHGRQMQRQHGPIGLGHVAAH